jgi:energy-coupling factor transporter ATP-binding protein EcfA2
VGPAIRSGKSCFLYGPPGTGKTTMAKKIAEFLDRTGGHYAVPHALLVGGSVIRVYDPVHHEKVEDQESHRASSSWLMENPGDRRWVLCRRPAVIVGGELSLDMLDLRYNPATKYYEAPLQVKANGGVLIVDDFGRQLVQPRDLLNRWIIPLEERIDYLTLHTGKKFAIPFDPLVVFATNLDPAGLVDEAFLRRIRYKIYIGEPSIDMYKRIFIAECKKKGLVIDPSFIEEIIHRCYRPNHRPLRACDPRDITDQIADYCAFHELPLRIPYELVEKTAAGYLSDLKTG